VRCGVVIPGYGAHRDGERRCGRRSTVGSIGGRAAVIRAIWGMRSGRGWHRCWQPSGLRRRQAVKGRKIHFLVDTEGLPMRVVVW